MNDGFDYPCHTPQEERWFFCRGTRFRDGESVRVVLVHTDITARKKAELIVRRNEKRFQDLFDFAPDAIVMTNAEGFITLANRQAVTLFGYARDELVGQAVETLMPHDDRTQHVELRRRFLSGDAMGGGQHRLRALKKDGSIFPAEISLGPIESEGGVLVAAAVRDISAREKLEAEFRQLQKLEAIGQLTGGLAHDFNNYLGVIIGNLDLLLGRVVNDSQAKDYIDTALSGALRGAELTKSLLAFARRQTLAPKVIDVRDCMSEISRLIERTLGEDIVVKLDLAPEPWLVRIDEAMLNTSILNLANNARDAMRHGGTLTLAVRNVESDQTSATINPNAEVAGDFVLIEISDTGSGMTPETLANAFEPFYSTKAVGHGTGLGLSMVYGFVKQSDGHIKICSEVGHGTNVRIYLPRVKDEHAAADSTSVKPVTSSRGAETILVVDDNQAIRRTAAQQLSDLGYRVLEAESGEAAVDILSRRECVIDLLFTDIIMPGKWDGYALARIAADQRPVIKVLLTSGFPGTQLNGKGKHTPDQMLLTKPYRKDDLARAIRAALHSGLPSTPGLA